MYENIACGNEPEKKVKFSYIYDNFLYIFNYTNYLLEQLL